MARVLGEVAEQGDAAVAKYTKEFDRVELRPAEFRVPAQDLAKAHASIDLHCWLPFAKPSRT